MSNLRKRLLTAAILIPVLIFLIWIGGIPYLILIIFFMCIGLFEFYRIMEEKGFFPLTIFGTIGGGLLAVAAFFSYFNVSFAALILLTCIIHLFRGDLNKAIVGISSTIFGLVYVGWFMSHAILLRNYDAMGFSLVILVLAVTFLNDTGAYFVGRFIGRHKLAPVTSPNKTWEGTIGGLISAVIATLAVKLILNLPFSYEQCIILGIVMGVGCILGDLVESLIKRDAKIKDSGSVLPGHGGVLDRVDSLLFTLPVCYYYIKILL